MLWNLFTLALSASIITLTTWVAGKNPRLAGLILTLPLSTLLALAFTQIRYQDSSRSVELAKGVFWSLPLSLTFFIPFFFFGRLPFWGLYASGIACLCVAYGIQQHFLR